MRGHKSCLISNPLTPLAKLCAWVWGCVLQGKEESLCTWVTQKGSLLIIFPEVAHVTGIVTSSLLLTKLYFNMGFGNLFTLYLNGKNYSSMFQAPKSD